MARLTLSVLGELRVLIDDVPVSTFESDKVRALLVYLAVEAGRAHRRETLSALLWPDYPEGAARHNLSQALFSLRLALDDHTARPPYLSISRDAIQFDRESDYSLDLDRFNASYSAWEKDRGRERAGTSNLLQSLEEMLVLYRGEFLQRFYLEDSAEYEEWLLVQRESLHQRMMNALILLVNEYEQHADYATARRYALRQLELDPWREEAHCQVMRLLALEGQRSAALAQYEHCRKVLAEELGVEPSSQTRELYEQIRSDTFRSKAEPPAPVASPPIHHLPVSLTPFIGREQELADLARLLSDPECRCITLAGPGGVGKTRLALHAAGLHSHAFAQGSAFIPLASVASIETVIPAIAKEIGFAFSGPSDPKNQLLNYLRDKQILLVVDNVEHLLGEPQQETIADLLVELLQASSQVKMLVTSREALNLQGEWSFEVQGLAFPASDQTESSDDYSAVALFAQSARRARPGFELRSATRPGVIRICRLVEGLPLAIELAAAWIRVLSPAEIAHEIETSLDFLNTQMRAVPERHRSMRAVFDHSWHMLADEEQRVIRRMSVFHGGITRQAAEAVAGAGLAVLSSLVTKSLLRRTSQGRYSLHELVHQYVADRLAEAPEEELDARDRHSAYYLEFVAGLEGDLKGAAQLQALAALDAEVENIRAGWRWAVRRGQTGALRKSIRALWYFFDIRGWFQEGESTFGWAADQLGDSPNALGQTEPVVEKLSAYSRALQGWFCFRGGQIDRSQALLLPSLATLRKFGPSKELADALYYLGAVTWLTGDFQRARSYFSEDLAVAEQSGDQWDIGFAILGLALLAQTVGEYEEAEERWQTTLAIGRRLGDRRRVAFILHFLGILKRILGAHLEAQAYLRESLELSSAAGDRLYYGMALSQLGEVSRAAGDHAEAVRLLKESVTLLRDLGEHWSLLHALIGLGAATLAIGAYTESHTAYCEALTMAWEGQSIPEVLEALAGMATWSAQQGEQEQALVTACFVLDHPATTEQTKEAARRLRVELESILSPDEIGTAQQLTGLKDLEEHVHQYLAGA